MAFRPKCMVPDIQPARSNNFNISPCSETDWWSDSPNSFKKIVEDELNARQDRVEDDEGESKNLPIIRFEELLKSVIVSLSGSVLSPPQVIEAMSRVAQIRAQTCAIKRAERQTEEEAVQQAEEEAGQQH